MKNQKMILYYRKKADRKENCEVRGGIKIPKYQKFERKEKG